MSLRSIDALLVDKFCIQFSIIDTTGIQFPSDLIKALSIDESLVGTINYTNEQFNARLRYSLPSFLRQFLI